MNPNKPDAAAEEKKTDFQIAWELSQTIDKPFFVDTFRKLLSLYDKEEISLSKVVEELNIAAYKWQSSQSGKDDMTAKEFYAALDGILTFDFLNEQERQTIFDFAELYAKGKLRQSGKERAALAFLVKVKEHKDVIGKDEWYEKSQPLAWEQARQALSTDVGEQDEKVPRLIK